MEKVAFLNLTINSFYHNRIWENFFNQGDKDGFNLYLHSKHQTKHPFSNYCIKNTVPTAWGHFSLVEATIELMKAALEDEENEYFTLISDSHFPLYDLDITVDLIKKKYKKTTFAKHFSFHTKVKSQKIFKEGIKGYDFGEYNAVCQFFVCRRKDVEVFIETFEHWSQFFVKEEVIFADEFYFWGIAKQLGMDFEMGQATTYSDWSARKDSVGNVERNPRAFDQINKRMVDVYRENGYLFVRKIVPSTFVTVDPLNY
tara:strand:+ start:3063 stop:3833 length:771 start_codon:yes stop_codon:yes gene_type:complete